MIIKLRCRVLWLRWGSAFSQAALQLRGKVRPPHRFGLSTDRRC